MDNSNIVFTVILVRDYNIVDNQLYKKVINEIF